METNQPPVSSKIQEARNYLDELQQNMIHDANKISTQEADRQAQASPDLLYRAEESMFKQRSRDSCCEPARWEY